MSVKILIFSCILALFASTAVVKAQDFDWYENPDNWQFGSDNYWVCAQMVNDSAKTRYADGAPVSASSAYNVTSELTSDQCGYGWIRLDHREILEVRDQTGAVVQQLVWHKGGQDYDSPQPPYGWVDINDISLFDGALEVPTAQNVPLREGTQPETVGMASLGMPLVNNQPLAYGAPYWNSGENMWDTTHMLGRGCVAEENVLYHYKMIPTSDPDGIPESWQYKQFTTSSRYNKYADGGANYGDGTAEYAWLMWNFLTHRDGETNVGGGGQMRGLIKNGQEFHRCKVKSIKAKAWEYNGDTQVGEITAWYVKTRGNPHSEWMFGWMIAEHREKNPDGSFGPSVFHYQIESVIFAANAGPDRTVYTHVDTATLTLVGGASTGSITSYIWSLDGSVPATGANPTVKLPLGTHEIHLTVTDTAGATSEDLLIVKVESAPDEIRYEAEDAMYGPGSVKSDGSVEYVDLQSDGNVRWEIPVYDSGYYKLVFRVAVPGGTRSMGVFVNGLIIGKITTSNTTFSEKSITALLDMGSTVIDLRDSEGTSELNVDYLELIYLGTSIPQGAVPRTEEFVRMYPNPLKAGESLTIEPDENFNSECTVEIFNLNGSKVYHRDFASGQGQMIIDDIELAESIYILEIRSERSRMFRKLIYYL